MAEVFHRYVRDPELAKEREAAAKRREAAARRKEAAKKAASRSAWAGVAGLRREKTAMERVRRLEKEMEISARRGELIEKSVAERQAAFLLVALRARCMAASSAWARRLLNISDAREMTEQLKDMMTSVLEEIADLPQKVTAGDYNEDELGNGNGSQE